MSAAESTTSGEKSPDYRPELLRFLISRLRCRASAEDVAQEAYLRLSINESKVRNPRAFLFEAAANLMRNVIRADRRRNRFTESASLVATEADPRTPERQALAAESLRRIEHVLMDLPPQCGRVFYLHRFEGLTQREIAERLGISTTAVEKHMRRAFARLMAAADSSAAEG